MSNDHEGLKPELDPESTPLQRAIHARHHGYPNPGFALDPDDQQLVDDIEPWLDALNEAAQQIVLERRPDGEPSTDVHIPIQADDPIALMLGLVPDPAFVVNGRKIADARKRARLDLGQLIKRLRARGWDVTVRQGFSWESGQPQLAPALITAIAEELSVDEELLLTTPPSRREHTDLFDDRQIQTFISDWAAEADIEPGVLREHASATLAAAAHRNRTEGSVEALLNVLRTLRSIPDFLNDL